MKVYTRTGDKGKTSLFSGKRVRKSHDLIHIFGRLDELNSTLGFSIFELSKTQGEPEGVARNGALEKERGRLLKIQSLLFSIGSFFASELEKTEYLKALEGWLPALEEAMDKMDETLDPLKNFILPGGALSACWSHQARVLTRAVEREVVALNMEAEGVDEVVSFLNRLSDYFFVLSRFINSELKQEENLWESGAS